MAMDMKDALDGQGTRGTLGVRIAAGSVLVGVVVLGMKALAWWLTGSVALYSDALESIVNVVTALTALVAVRLSAKPADAAMPYGYHKAEYVSAVVVGVMIVAAALAIFHAAYEGFVAPVAMQMPLEGLLVNGAAGALNAAWCWVLISQGRKMKSPALVADGKHLLTDVLSSGGVVLGVALAAVTGWQILDPLLAVLVALNVLWSGWELLAESVGGLMDVAVPPEVLARIKRVIGDHAEGALEAHDVRTRQAGRVTFIDFHLVVPGTMRVDEAHAICDRVEQALFAEMDDTVVNIHVEPETKAKDTAAIKVL